MLSVASLLSGRALQRTALYRALSTRGGNELSVGECIAYHAARQPHAPAVTEGTTGRTLTYEELECRSNQLARTFLDRLRGRDPVGRICTLAMHNSVELMQAAVAI